MEDGTQTKKIQVTCPLYALKARRPEASVLVPENPQAMPTLLAGGARSRATASARRTAAGSPDAALLQ